MREKILGNEWWFDKLTKYKDVRWKMTQSGANVDKMAELEMQRFKEDEERNRRMRDRQIEIDKETSVVRKAILQAKQLMDELA